ncbi:MAG: ABC transporter permease [Firmicutes bacterium]|nr:ABC transporter permease [Bacillota bacterium]
MVRKTLSKVLMTIPVLIGVSLLVFLLLRSLPGDPALIYLGPDATEAEVIQLRARMGLDNPLALQYLSFLGDLLRGNLGTSLRTGRPVLTELWARVNLTAQLATATVTISSLFGVFLGIFAAIKPRLTPVLLLLSTVGISTPVYWSGLLLILVFSVHLGWLPPAGGAGWRSLVLPVIALSAATFSALFRLTLNSYQEILHEDYMRTARAKGVSGLRLHGKHGLRNALVPISTFLALEFGNLLGGAVLTESVFSLNGIGRYLVTAIAQRDYPVVQGAVLLLCFLFVLINLIVDLVYILIDPRVRS